MAVVALSVIVRSHGTQNIYFGVCLVNAFIPHNGVSTCWSGRVVFIDTDNMVVL